MKKWILRILIFVIVISACSFPSMAMEKQSYVVDAEGEKMIIPLAYEVKDIYVSFPANPDTIVEPQDICVDKDDNLYILDSGNGRVLKQSPEGELLKVICPDGAYKLSNPQGIYAADDGRIYIADTGNGRVLILSEDGKVEKAITQPKDPLYDASYSFAPVKVGVNMLGQIYAINQNDYHGFCILDENNTFKGYFAATKLSSDFWRSIIKKFASESQAQQMGKVIPAQRTNFTFDEDGSIYVTTANVTTGQFMQLSAVGSNFYPYSGSFGDQTVDYLMILQNKDKAEAKFVDVCVDQDKVITLLDNVTGRLYQYDSYGVLLMVFGGTGSWAGRMMDPAALAEDSTGRIYVVDRFSGSVQCFVPTDFTKTVHSAVSLYNSGKYEEALALWNEVLAIAPEYPPAHVGLAKAEVKQKDYKAAMADYKIAGDKAGYSDTFARYLKEVIRMNFVWVVILVILFAVALIKCVVMAKNYAVKVGKSEKMYHKGRHITALTIFAPEDAFRAIQYDRNEFYAMAPTLILVGALVSRILRLFLTHYPFTEQSMGEISLAQEICSFLIPFVLWVLGSYYVTCIFVGEVKLKELYASVCYSLLPCAVFTVPVALLTNLFGVGSAGSLNFLETVIWLWVAILIFISLKTMNHYRAGETLKVIFVSVIAVLILAVVMTLLYLLGMKMLNFLGEVFAEWKVRFL